MDHNRTDEVRAATADLLAEVGRNDLVRRHGTEVDVDWAGLDAWLGSAGPGFHERERELLATLEERFERPYPSLMGVRFVTDEPFDFVAGQYVAISYHGVPRPYSISSSPNREGVELCITRVPGGDLTGELFEHLQVGQELTVRGPYGELSLMDPSPRDMVFLATGTGVAPFKSMIDYAFEAGWDEYRGETRDVWLFLGASWRDDLPYRSAFRDLDAAHGNFHFVPTCSRERYLTDWQGETAYVQQTMQKYLADGVKERLTLPPTVRGTRPRTDVDARLRPESMEIYACGISAMVDMLVATATDLGVPTERIEAESYG